MFSYLTIPSCIVFHSLVYFKRYKENEMIGIIKTTVKQNVGAVNKEHEYHEIVVFDGTEYIRLSLTKAMLERAKKRETQIHVSLLVRLLHKLMGWFN